MFLHQVPNLNFFFRKNYRTSLTERKHWVFQIFVFLYPGKLFCTFALRDEVRSFGKHAYAWAIWVPVCRFWYPTREFQRFVSSTYRQFRLYYFYSPIYTSRVACVLQGSVCSRVVALIGKNGRWWKWYLWIWLDRRRKWLERSRWGSVCGP